MYYLNFGEFELIVEEPFVGAAEVCETTPQIICGGLTEKEMQLYSENKAL
jgi:hypothetical protein